MGKVPAGEEREVLQLAKLNVPSQAPWSKTGPTGTNEQRWTRAMGSSVTGLGTGQGGGRPVADGKRPREREREEARAQVIQSSPAGGVESWSHGGDGFLSLGLP